MITACTRASSGAPARGRATAPRRGCRQAVLDLGARLRITRVGLAWSSSRSSRAILSCCSMCRNSSSSSSRCESPPGSSAGVTVHDSGAAPVPLTAKLEIMLGIAAIVGAGVLDRGHQHGRAGKQVVERLARHVLAAHLEKILRRGVHVTHGKPGIHRHHRGRQQIEAGESRRSHVRGPDTGLSKNRAKGAAGDSGGDATGSRPARV